MKTATKALLLTATLICPLATAGSLNCHAPPPLPHGTVIRHFDVPQTANTAVAPDFADLTGTGVAELVQPGQREEAWGLATVSARERIAGNRYRTRATLPIPYEQIWAVKTIAGNLVGIDAPAVVLVASVGWGHTWLRYVRGDTWQVERICDFGGSGIARIAEIVEGGDPALYIGDDTSITVYSVIDGSLIRTIPVPGFSPFAVGQLDADPAMEVVGSGTPGLIADAVSGAIEATHAPGFGRELAIGRSAGGGHWLAASSTSSPAVNLFTTNPLVPTWTIPESGFSTNPRKLAVHDADGDGTDDLLVAGEFLLIPTQLAYEVRSYDVNAQIVRRAEPLERFGMISYLAALPARQPGIPEVAATYSNQFPQSDLATFTHPFGDPANGEENWQQYGPFSALAEGDADGNTSREFVYSGTQNERSSGGRLHVVSNSDWSVLWEMPTAYVPDYANFPQTFDVATIDSPYGPGQLLILSGHSTYGSLVAVDGTTHALRWKFGTVSGQPMPLGYRTANRMAVGDVDGDGQQEILVGASDSGAPDYPGSRLHLISPTGDELWNSDALTAHRDVNALRLLSGGNGRMPLALLSTNTGTLAFELPGRAPAWEVAGAALGIQPLQAGGFAILHTDCSIQRLDAQHQSLWRSRPVAISCTAIHEPIPGGPLLVSTGDGYGTSPMKLRWLSAASGVQVGVSDSLMAQFASGNRWKVVPESDSTKVVVTAGGTWGLMQVEVPVPAEDVIFMDVFE